MKKIIVGALSALLLAGCGSTSALRGTTGAMASSIKTGASAVSLVPLHGKTTNALTAPASFAKKTETEVPEVQPSDFSDFLSFYEEGIPEDAVFPPLRSMKGPWKYYLDMQDLDTGGVEFNEFGLADVNLNTRKETMKIILHPKMAGDGYELYPEDETEVGYEPFEGGFTEESSLLLNGNDLDVYVCNYFAWSGREYVMGEVWYPQEGYWGLFLLTRGQN